jgi:hypothetical protein
MGPTERFEIQAHGELHLTHPRGVGLFQGDGVMFRFEGTKRELAELSGLPLEEVEDGMRELAQAGWITEYREDGEIISGRMCVPNMTVKASKKFFKKYFGKL